MRLVADTNTLISGSLWQGPPAELISAALRGQAQLYLSLPMLLELRETLQRAKFAARLAGCGQTAESLTELFRAACRECDPVPISVPNLRDPDDIHVLACAVGASADAIISGDHDLLALKSFQGIPILTVRETLQQIGIAGEK